MTEGEKTVEQIESDCWHREEVHGGNGFSVISQKGEPPLRRFGISRGAPHPTGDSSFGNVKTQHQQLAVDTRRAPGWILAHHPKDEILHLLRNPSSADHPASFGDSTPINRKSRSVPTHDGLRTHNNESLFPSEPDSSRQHPEEFIERCQSRPWMSSFQCRELLAKSEVFEKQPATTLEESEDRARQECKPVYHVRVLSRFGCGWQCRILLKSQAD